MITADTLLETIDTLGTQKYIKKSDRISIIENLEIIPMTNTEKKEIEPITDILSKGLVSAKEIKYLTKIKPDIIKIVKKYKEVFNEEPNEDDINENLTTNEIEQKIDEKIPKYNKYNEKHPMEGVFYSSKKLWRFNLDKHDKTNKNINKIVEYAKQFLIPENSKNFGNIRVKKSFAYKDHFFVTYWKDNEPYFDIQHIISVLNLKKSSWLNKYNEFSNEIVYCIWHQNEFEGYILRELINEETMYKLALSSNSDFSKSFKNDIAKILVELRKDGQLTLTNKKLKNNKSAQNEINATTLISKQVSDLCTYNSYEGINYAQYLINCGTLIILSKFIDKHVLYAFIIPLKLENDYIIIKFGYTNDLLDRFTTLQAEYHCNVFFIGAKLITRQKDERKFHKMIKKKYPQCIQKYYINTKEKEELYKLSPSLFNEFINYNVTDDSNDSNDTNETYEYSQEELKIFDYLKKQESIFMNSINYNFITDEKMRFKYVCLKESNLHERMIKDKEIIAKNKEIKLNKIQQASLKIQLKIDLNRNNLLDKELELAKLQKSTKPSPKEILRL